MLASAFIAVSALFFAGSASATDCARKYTAVEGDICDSISARNNASTYQFATVNYGTVDAECSNLVPGKEYCLGLVGSDCKTTTIVQAGDTCEGIQARGGINSTLLYLNNPQINADCTNIYIGEVLCVASTVAVPEAPAGVTPATAIPATATPAVTTSSTVPASTKIAVATPVTPAGTTTATPAPTSSSVAPAAPAPTDDGSDDDDDEDLPWCDEL